MGPEMSSSEFLKALLSSAYTDLFSGEVVQWPVLGGTQKQKIEWIFIYECVWLFLLLL